MASPPPVAVLMIGTGEYTTGFGANSSQTDKGAGVVGLTMFDLRKRGYVGDLHMAGVNGTKLPAIRAHMKSVIGGLYPKSDFDFSLKSYPEDDKVDPKAYLTALDALPKGSAVIIFTPDDIHFEQALAAVERGHHVLVTKPVVKTLDEHARLAAAAAAHNVLVAVEVHKRWDPLYTDACHRLRTLGDFSYMNAYMSQPKLQLETFRAWAGISSDISFYLNSHHVDLHEWVVAGRARPVRVYAMAATGVARAALGRECEDTISINVTWLNLESGSTGIASYTASWVAPKSDVHSQQRFFCMMQKGEVSVDQAHRGYTAATDAAGFASPNPLFFKYTPDDGKFVGQLSYGYRSFEAFIAAVNDVRAGRAAPRDFDHSLASIHTTFQTTAILEAARVSLDNDGAVVELQYGSGPEARADVPIGMACKSLPAAAADSGDGAARS